VVTHFIAFPYFSRSDGVVPVMTSAGAAHLVCNVKLIRAIAAHSRTDVRLHAGSLIGALRHGGPVPWDDDMDLAMPFNARDAFLDACNAFKDALHRDITLVCQRNHTDMLKVFIQNRCSRRDGMCSNGILSQKTPYPWRWPFVDVFLYKANATAWRIVSTDGAASRIAHRNTVYPSSTLRPVQQYYFGGIVVPGPRPEYVDALFSVRQGKAHAWKTCRTSTWNHQKEARVPKEAQFMHLNCCQAAGFVPFVVDNGTRLVGRDGRQIVLGLE
jgi:hypothetical protein